jgi:hypothetical protein
MPQANRNFLDSPSTIYITRAVLAFPVEHFVDMAKTAAQKSSHQASWKVISDIYKREGFRGFTAGALPNFPRRVFRDAIRWPVIGYAYHVLTDNFPQTFPEKSTVSAVFSGLAAAHFDALVLGPLELLMSHQINKKEGYIKFFQERFSQEGIRCLYQGAGVNLAYRCTVWSTHMGVTTEVKKRIKTLPSYAQEITAAVCSSTILVGCVLPFDFVKTQILMNKDLQGQKVSRVVQTLIKQHGYSGFYAAAPIVWTFNIFYSLVFQRVLQVAMDSYKKQVC